MLALLLLLLLLLFTVPCRPRYRLSLMYANLLKLCNSTQHISNISPAYAAAATMPLILLLPLQALSSAAPELC
jgi:hypothetical protein